MFKRGLKGKEDRGKKEKRWKEHDGRIDGTSYGVEMKNRVLEHLLLAF